MRRMQSYKFATGYKQFFSVPRAELHCNCGPQREIETAVRIVMKLQYMLRLYFSRIPGYATACTFF
jgi:hypothetical protein